MNLDATERAQLVALKTDWATCRQQIDPFFDPRTQPRSSQQFGLARDHLARWIAYLQQHYLDAAHRLQQSGQPALEAQLSTILGELRGHLGKFATEMDIKASIERGNQYIRTMRDDMAKSQAEAFKRHNELWQKVSDASTPHVWRDVETFQRAADDMWRNILNRHRR